MKTSIQQLVGVFLAALVLVHCGPPSVPVTTLPTNGTPSNSTGLPAASGTGPVSSGTGSTTSSGSPNPVSGSGSGQTTLSELVFTAGSSGNGTGSVTGTVGGHTLNTTAVFFDALGSGGSTTYAGVFITNDANACNSLVNDANFNANSTYALLLLSAVDPNGNNVGLTLNNYTAVDPNVASVPAGTYSTFMFEPVDAACQPLIPTTSQAAENGQFQLSTLNVGSNAIPNSLVGQFSFGVGTPAATLKGTVQAVPCPGMLNILLNPSAQIGCE